MQRPYGCGLVLSPITLKPSFYVDFCSTHGYYNGTEIIVTRKLGRILKTPILPAEVGRDYDAETVFMSTIHSALSVYSEIFEITNDKEVEDLADVLLHITMHTQRLD